MIKTVVCMKNGDASISLSHADSPLAIQILPRQTTLTPKQVRIAVHFASLNFPDALQIAGTYQTKLKPPFVPGSEASGVVIESTSQSFKIGDRVIAIVEQGALAEELLAHENVVFRVPSARVSLEEAAVVPVAYGTAELALRHRAKIKPGSTLLVLGAAGGVGVAACQLGLMVGARVIAVCSGHEKAAYLQQMGVQDTVDLSCLPSGSSMSKEVRKLCKGGVDVVFDPVGGSLFAEALKSVAWGAEYLVIGFAGGIPNVPANHLLVKNTTLHGIFWGSYLQNDPKALQAGISFLLQCIEERKLAPRISSIFPMERIDQAFQLIKERRVVGKCVVRVRPDSKL